jgi:hypothetical protein
MDCCLVANIVGVDGVVVLQELALIYKPDGLVVENFLVEMVS